VKITLWGTRGSLASAGPETIRYGGNTACVEVRADDGSILILDAGSGIRRLGESIGTPDGPIHILLTHLHLDHIQGLGFFGPLFRGGVEVHLWGPPSTTADLRTRLGRYLSPPLFPVRLRDLGARLVLHDAPATPTIIGPFVVRAELVIHPGPTVGYRITDGHRTLAYLPDHEPALGVPEFGTMDVRAWNRPRRRCPHPRRAVHGVGIPATQWMGSLEHQARGCLRRDGLGWSAGHFPP